MRKFLGLVILFFVLMSIYAVNGLGVWKAKYRYVIKSGIFHLQNYEKWSFLKTQNVCDDNFRSEDFDEEFARAKLSDIKTFVYQYNNILNCVGIENIKNFFIKNELKFSLLLNLEDIYLVRNDSFEWVNYWIFRTNKKFNVDTQIQVYKRMREVCPKAKIGFYLVQLEESKIKEINEYYADILVLDNDNHVFVRPYIVWEKDKLPENFIFDGYLF
ncbi:MAG: hypothetical protein N3A71_03050 [Candidatus Dojkabacteria bacterium]|nr:hypothetical protein [Candidatus Dojkabacteria bacterium]